MLCKAQISQNPLNTGDSLLSTYISSSMENFTGWDSCFAGIYFLKFFLTNKGQIKNFEVSDLMPGPFKLEIKKAMEELKGKWTLPFLSYVSKKKKAILQPVFIYYDKECFYRENFYSKKLANDSLGGDYSKLLAQTSLTNFVNLFLSTKETFMQAMKLNDNQAYWDCIMLTPCFITPKAKVWKGVKVD